jgi:hypothetical protein
VVGLLALAAACGGRSIRHADGGEAGDDAEGTGGVGGVTAGTGGRGSGATGGTGMGAVSGVGGSAGTAPVPPAFCEFEGRVLAVGQTTEDELLCRTCTCQPNGDVECTQCDATCRVASTVLHVGDTMLHTDGCTTCLCTVNGMDCDGSACSAPDPCGDLAKEYELAVGAARWCGREYGDITCNAPQRFLDSIPCGCEVLVRGGAMLIPIGEAYFGMGCPVPPVCERACPPPIRPPYRCGEAGFCVGS